MLIPYELLSKVYRSDFRDVESEIPRLEEWWNELPEDFRRVYPVDFSERIFDELNATGPTEFFYDRTQFNHLDFEKNYGLAIRLLEECYALKDTYKELDRRIFQEALQEELDKRELALSELEDAMIVDGFQTLGGAVRSHFVETEQGWEAQPASAAEEPALARALEIAEHRRSMRRYASDKLRAARATPGNSFRISEKRQRVKAKYFHTLVELVSLIEALRHGMHDVFGQSPVTLVVEASNVDSTVRHYRNRPGTFPEFDIVEDSILADSFADNFRQADSWFPALVQSVVREAAMHLQILLTTLDLKTSPLGELTAAEFIERCTPYVADPVKLAEDVNKAYAKHAERSAERRADIDVENDIRGYLWEVAKTLQAFELRSEDRIEPVSLKSALARGRSEGDAKEAWKAFCDGKMTDLSLPVGQFGGTRLLGVGAEMIVSSARTIKTKRKKNNDIPQFDIYEPVEYAFIGKTGRVELEAHAPGEASPRTIGFTTNSAIFEQSALSSQWGSPRFFGENRLKNICPEESKIRISLTPDFDRAKIEDVLLYAHVRTGFETDA